MGEQRRHQHAPVGARRGHWEAVPPSPGLLSRSRDHTAADAVARVALHVLERQQLAAALTDTNGSPRWMSSEATRFVQAALAETGQERCIPALPLLQELLDEVALVPGAHAMRELDTPQQTLVLHVENRVDDPHVNGLVWWAQSETSRDARTELLEAVVERIGRELAPLQGTKTPNELDSVAVGEDAFTLIPDIERLSPRELEVLHMVREGLRAPTIARELFVSASTVRIYLSSIYRKLGVASQVELLELLVDARRRSAWVPISPS